MTIVTHVKGGSRGELEGGRCLVPICYLPFIYCRPLSLPFYSVCLRPVLVLSTCGSTSFFSSSVCWIVSGFLPFSLWNGIDMRSKFSLTYGLHILLLPSRIVICSIHLYYCPPSRYYYVNTCFNFFVWIP